MKTRKRFLFLPLLLLLMTLAVMPVSAGSPAKVPHNKLSHKMAGPTIIIKRVTSSGTVW